ncbi:MAG: polyprenyl synthetase family protein [Candidatus Glassbacteria bacterium]|nr:polyprenyl synthetase family protein [Candidatus Glassbacteria bacterium]
MLGLKSDWRDSFARLQSPVADDLERIKVLIGELVHGDFGLVDQAVDHLFSTSGKMLRPMLMLLAAGNGGAARRELISMGAAIELIHTASLVHDDSIDHSAFRRGVPTLNAKWDHKTSVIIGDYLLAQAFSEIARLGDFEIISEVTRACRSLALGEMRQMSMEGDLGVGEEDYFAFIREKTSSLFKVACVVASILNGGDNRKVLSEYGMLFGSIYQITDDLLDYIGSTPETGKPTVMDILDRKMTLPLIHAVSRMSPEVRDEVQAVFAGGKIDRAQAERVAALVQEAGGIEYTRSRALALAAEAVKLLQDLPDRDQAAKLKRLVELIVERDR